MRRFDLSRRVGSSIGQQWRDVTLPEWGWDKNIVVTIVIPRLLTHHGPEIAPKSILTTKIIEFTPSPFTLNGVFEGTFVVSVHSTGPVRGFEGFLNTFRNFLNFLLVLFRNGQVSGGIENSQRGWSLSA